MLNILLRNLFLKLFDGVFMISFIWNNYFIFCWQCYFQRNKMFMTGCSSVQNDYCFETPQKMPQKTAADESFKLEMSGFRPTLLKKLSMTVPFKLLLAIPNLIILHTINLYKSVSETLTWEIALLLENGNQFPQCHFPGKEHFEKKNYYYPCENLTVQRKRAPVC